MLILSGSVNTILYPLTEATRASPIPVFPEVDSTIVPPGLSFPERSASSMMLTPMRSLTDPPGFMDSTLARINPLTPAVTRRRRTSGVFPIVPSMFST